MAFSGRVATSGLTQVFSSAVRAVCLSAPIGLVAAPSMIEAGFPAADSVWIAAIIATGLFVGLVAAPPRQAPAPAPRRD